VHPVLTHLVEIAALLRKRPTDRLLLPHEGVFWEQPTFCYGVSVASFQRNFEEFYSGTDGLELQGTINGDETKKPPASIPTAKFFGLDASRKGHAREASGTQQTQKSQLADGKELDVKSCIVGRGMKDVPTIILWPAHCNAFLNEQRAIQVYEAIRPYCDAILGYCPSGAILEEKKTSAMAYMRERRVSFFRHKCDGIVALTSISKELINFAFDDATSGMSYHDYLQTGRRGDASDRTAMISSASPIGGTSQSGSASAALD